MDLRANQKQLHRVLVAVAAVRGVVEVLVDCGKASSRRMKRVGLVRKKLAQKPTGRYKVPWMVARRRRRRATVLLKNNWRSMEEIGRRK